MKAGMWVRNGLSLRHQAGTYRGFQQRDVSHHRDIFLLQTALVVCNPSRVLASIVDRFGMETWVKGFFEQKSKAQDDVQHLDVVEDMIHLLIVLLSDRTSLMPTDDEMGTNFHSMRRDITHVLCFKPLSFNDIMQKLPDKFQEQEDFHKILEEMTTFKQPEGITDVGTFELKPEYIEDIDPYIAHYTKNQREESENAYRRLMAKKTGKSAEDIVYEPKLRPLSSGLFAGLSRFTGTGMFAQIVYYSLLYPLVSQRLTPNVPSTRIETFLQVILHLILIAISEDHSSEEDASQHSFIATAFSQQARSNFMPEAPQAKTIVALLNMMSIKEEFKACHPKIALILKRMRQKRPQTFEAAYHALGLSIDRINTSSPAVNTADEERERKKRAALERQAKVMAQFQAQQKSFMENQGEFNWGEVEDLVEDEGIAPAEEHRNHWKYPTGTCILCQEDTDDRRLYGTFAFFTESKILRQTDLQDPDFVREVFNTPDNLDRSAEDIRPFGVSHENRIVVQKVNASGETFETERQVIGKGFPSKLSRTGPVAVGCGHIMHYSCFEMYFEATVRRHIQQIARHHPEDTDRYEFVCPLCKALGNAFLPIVWKGQEESYPGPLQARTAFGSFLGSQMASAYYTLGATRAPDQIQKSFEAYTASTLINNLAEKSSQLLEDAWVEVQPATATLTPYSETFEANRAVSDPNNIMRELVAVYRRLRDTLRKNELETHHAFHGDPNELFSSDTLARSVGYSIAAVEIQQRGVEAEYGMTFLERVPDQVLTQLRILAETVTSYIAVGGLKEAGDNRIDNEYRRDCERQHCQLFIAQYFGEETDTLQRPADAYPPLLGQDPFIFLTECVFGLIPAQNFEISHIIRLCYLLEITKVVYHMGRNMPATTWLDRILNRPQNMDPKLANFAEFCEALVRIDVQFQAELPSFAEARNVPLGENQGFDQPGFDTWEAWYSFTKKYALAFARKCLVLLYVKYGVDFNSHISPSPEQNELERLTEALRLPSFDEMLTALTSFGPQYDWPADTRRLVEGWCKHYAMYPQDVEEEQLPASSLLSHPGIFELIGLPKNYDTLIEECTRRQCPTKGKDITDPTICLFCGDVFCGQAICCAKDEKDRRGRPIKIGGAQQHMRTCQKNIGFFINIRKCCVFYLHRMTGSFSHAPYIDRYGEVDMGLRHFRQLFLHQKRYDSMLRNLWLTHGGFSFISRKLEADINNGGWETV
ncbi:hypothetical protein GQ53DRAFT_746997 [Thozetella sp. PMI_491]|nr:hypothetical protein GQ53DRAFT_746997 [Thozetella sp. PMI_491]